jgi:hypothetical protein
MSVHPDHLSGDGSDGLVGALEYIGSCQNHALDNDGGATLAGSNEGAGKHPVVNLDIGDVVEEKFFLGKRFDEVLGGFQDSHYSPHTLARAFSFRESRHFPVRTNVCRWYGDNLPNVSAVGNLNSNLFPAQHHAVVIDKVSPGQSWPNLPHDLRPFLSEEDREFVARCWIAILLFCAVSWVAIIKLIISLFIA